MKIHNFLVRAGKLVTVSKTYGTIIDGAVIVQDGKIIDIGEYSNLSGKYKNIKILDYKDYVVTPSLIDCHTHVLEYAPPSVYGVKNSAHIMGGISLLLTLNPANILGKDKMYGSFEIGKDANFLVANGIPGLEVTDKKDILEVYFKGDRVISKL